MIDKGKYASHGVFIKRFTGACAARWNKPKAAIINPLPQNKSKLTATQSTNDQTAEMQVNSSQFKTKFRFQSLQSQKPVPADLVQPFLYIERLTKKKDANKKRPVQPFVTSKNPRNKTVTKDLQIPKGYQSLYDYEQRRRLIAQKVFQKLMEADIQNIMEIYSLWGKKGSKKVKPQITQEEFISFMVELLPQKLSNRQLKLFFDLHQEKREPKDERLRLISMKAFCFNYQKFKKTQSEVSNILSEKAVKDRYNEIKHYFVEFDKHYPGLKQAMTSIKNYEQSLRRHFQSIYHSYRNPYEHEIQQIQQELQKPLIKYDKYKKQELTDKLQHLEQENQKLHTRITDEFHTFMEVYEKAILLNHDLFFTKRTVCKLLVPLMGRHAYLTKALIIEETEVEQNNKQQYLECLSDYVVEIEKDKKHLNEDCVTLDEITQMVLMNTKARKPSALSQKYDASFVVKSLKKLIKEVKKQFLLKHDFMVTDFDQFPADQQISLQLLNTCFQMECTKVLFKNQVWNELINMIPDPEIQSNYHQKTIDSNFCLECIKRYTKRLDERSNMELNKSKEISLVAQNATLETFGQLSQVITNVIDQLNDYVEGDDATQPQPVQPDKKKVGFADVVESKVAESNNLDVQLINNFVRSGEENEMAKSIIKSIHEDTLRKKQHQSHRVEEDPQIPENLSQLKTLTRSFFMPQAVNTNAFDIRFFQKQKESEPALQEEFIRMGSSILVSNLPKVDELETQNPQDPLRISRFLLKTIDEGVKEQKKKVHEQHYEHNVREGVENNYYREKVKLENRPTVFDCEGKSKYSVLFPVGYYESYLVSDNTPSNDQWYLRPHHVESLTENPLSKKDNMIQTQYKSKMQKMQPKKRPDEHIIEENVGRKQDLISNLEERVAELKGQLQGAGNASKKKPTQGAKVPTRIVNDYLSKIVEGKEDKELELAGYDAVLYDLRRKERQLLNNRREHEDKYEGIPEDKWWERKDKDFNRELRKQRLLASDDLNGKDQHHQYVSKLQNKEIY